MTNDATERVIEAMQSAPMLVRDFVTDLVGDPDGYGPEDKDWIGRQVKQTLIDLIPPGRQPLPR